MHYLQKSILDKLSVGGALRYSQLHPKHLESSHFRYHLLQLANDGYLEKNDKTYQLTTLGKSYVDKLSTNSVLATQMPKVISYTLLYDDKNYYLHLKTKEPYKDLLNLIGGKVHYGEFSQKAAVREVSEKADIPAAELSYCGQSEIKIYESQELISHVIAVVYSSYVDSAPADLVAIPRLDISQASGLAPDCLGIISLIESKESFHTTIECSLDSR